MLDFCIELTAHRESVGCISVDAFIMYQQMLCQQSIHGVHCIELATHQEVFIALLVSAAFIMYQQMHCQQSIHN